MHHVGPASRVVLVAVVAWAGACGGGARNPAGDECGYGIGLGAPPCTCASWTNYVGPSTCSECARLEPDLSASPARATVRVGEAVMVGSSVENGRPEHCNQGGWNNRPTWTASDPSVLRLEATAPASFSTATFRAIAPGTSTVSAEDLVTPTGQVERVGLTTCTRTVSAGLWSECAGRVPLEIRVVP
jgi:hypothetical protein